MGAGQPAAAGPAVDDAPLETSEADARPYVAPVATVIYGEPTMTLGEFNSHIAPLRIDTAGLELLGFPAAGRRKAAVLYHDTDKAAMVAAMVKHLRELMA